MNRDRFWMGEEGDANRGERGACLRTAKKNQDQAAPGKAAAARQPEPRVISDLLVVTDKKSSKNDLEEWRRRCSSSSLLTHPAISNSFIDRASIIETNELLDAAASVLLV